MVHDREKLSPVLDSAPKKSIRLGKTSKNVLNSCKNAGLSYWCLNTHILQQN
jgi:hypothetical protein